MLSETSFRPVISASIRSSMALRFSARRSSSSPERPTGSRPERSPAMMRWVVPVMASIRRSTRRATKMPPPMPSTMTTRIDHCAAFATMVEQPPAFLQIATDQQPKTVVQFGDVHQRPVIAGVLIVKPSIGGLRPAQGRHHAWRQRADIAADRLSRRGGEEIKIGSRTQRAVADGPSQPLQSPPIVDVVDLAGFGVHRGGDLLGDEAARVPGEIGQQRSGKEREQKQIDQRQPKRRGADQLTECRHGSCIRRRGSCAARAAQNPCRSWSAAVRYARR